MPRERLCVRCIVVSLKTRVNVGALRFSEEFGGGGVIVDCEI
jgi:hypothetical protein